MKEKRNLHRSPRDDEKIYTYFKQTRTPYVTPITSFFCIYPFDTPQIPKNQLSGLELQTVTPTEPYNL